MREFELDEEKQEAEEADNNNLSSSATEKKRRLEQWCTTAYGEVPHPTMQDSWSLGWQAHR